MARVKFEGHNLDARTRDMVIAARVVCKAPLEITQGCYNAGGVAASAGTHDGGGAVDIRAKTLSAAQIKEAVNILRKVGFAAWHRTEAQGNWVEHIHCIAVGCPDLSTGAKSQVNDYKANRNGLANKRADDGPRTWVAWTWEKYKKTYPNLLTEDVVLDSDIEKIANRVVAKMTPVTQSFSAFNAKNLTQQLSTLLANFEKLEQTYTVASNNFTRQDSDASDTAILNSLGAGISELKSLIAALAADVDEVQADVDKLEAAAPKA